MLVLMKRNDQGAQDGITVERFVEGQTYHVTAQLGKDFLSIGSAVEVEMTPDVEPEETGDVTPEETPEATPKETGEVEADEVKVKLSPEAASWPLSMSPEAYLKRFPEGPKAELAQILVDAAGEK